MSNTWHIYSLTDPRDGRVRYVGKTTHPKQRLSAHICEAIHKVNRCHRVNWIRSVLESGAMPTLSVLEVGTDDWRPVERKWIKNFRDAGCELVNSTDGGDGVDNPTAEVRAKIGAAGKLRRDSPETRAKKSAASKAKWTPEYRAKARAERKARWQNPEYRARMVEKRRTVAKSPEFRAKQAAIHKAQWQDPEYRARMVAKRKEQGSRADFRAKMAGINRAHWDSPEYRAKHAKAMASYRAKKETVA